MVRLAVIEDIISGLRKDKVLLRKRLEQYEMNRREI